jgi:hypothetical protein
MGLLDLLFVVAAILNHTVALRFCLLQPWLNHMGTARHCSHHNTFPTAFRTQNITVTKKMMAAKKLLPNFFVNKEIALIR